MQREVAGEVLCVPVYFAFETFAGVSFEHFSTQIYAH